MQIAIIGDRMMGIEEVGSEYLDRGIFFGDGVYEVLRSYNGKIFAIDEHFERFANSLKAIEIAGVDVGKFARRFSMRSPRRESPTPRYIFISPAGQG